MRGGKFILFTACLAFMASLFLVCPYGAEAGEQYPLRGFLKESYKAEDTVSRGLDPNVLFLLDTSTAMTFAPWGVMPNKNDGRTRWQRGQMLKHSTYGHGMRPPRFGNGNGVEQTALYGDSYLYGNRSYNRYGREFNIRDSWENNLIGDPNCYYTSDPNKFFLLTFRNRFLAHYTNWIVSTGTSGGRERGRLNPPTFGNNSTLPSGGVVGNLNNNAKTTALNDYNAIKNYIPTEYVKNDSGVWVPADAPNPEEDYVPFNIANEHLVPNDSRMYKMKLVLWRMTEDSNKEMLSRMNVATAISYQDVSPGDAMVSVATKSATPNAREGEEDYYGATSEFPYGNAADYVLGTTPTSNPRGAYMSQWTRRGVLVDAYLNANPGDTMWNTLSRAVMYIPFSKLYQASGANMVIEPTAKLGDFRDYIRGYEHYEATNDSRTKKPIKDEFWASSLTLLSTAIYGGRSSNDNITGFNHFPIHKGKKTPRNQYMIQFAVTDKNDAGSGDDHRIFLEGSTNSEGLKTGQAVGSVFDFFNPPATGSDEGLDGVEWTKDTAGFFPVTGSCQQNWLVVFCAGNSAIPGYKPATAVNKLFNNSLTMRGRVLDTKNTQTTADDEWKYSANLAMDSGIRTLVVGFLPDQEEGEDASIKEVRKDLNEMAKEGDPVLFSDPDNPNNPLNGTYYVSNDHAVPYFANDVPGLLRALNNVLKRIYVADMGSGEPVNLPNILEMNADNPNKRTLFSATYKMNPYNQWSSWLTKSELTANGAEPVWEANANMPKPLTSRRLLTARGTGTDTETVNVDANNLRTLAGIPSSAAANFDKWLREYDEGLGEGSALRMGILGDMVHSGITVVGKPKALNPTSTAQARDALVYTQTNRGILHALSYVSGDEKWAFIPPNIFQSDKLKGLKFERGTNGDWTWMGGNGYTEMRSNPMVLLDGMLIARDIPDASNPDGGKTVLTGYLGSGGNGFYTMDVTRGQPVFEWGIESARYADTPASAPVSNVIKRWGKAAGGVEGQYDYRDLGLTIVPGVYFDPAPADDGSPTHNGSAVGVLPGGLGHKLGKDGDAQGKAFYFFNPLDGSIRAKIDTAPTSRFEGPAGASLGMGISPVVYYENSVRKAIQFYTADSEGNLLMCDNLIAPVENWTLKSVFQLKTLGSGVAYEPGDTKPAPAPGLPVAIPRRLTFAKAGGGSYSWLFGGTSDLYGPGSRGRTDANSPSLTDPVSGGSNEPEKYTIKSDEHYIFGINLTNALKEDKWRMGITPMDQNIRKLVYYNDNIPAEYGSYGRGGYVFNRTQIAEETKKMEDFGWVLRLRPAIVEKAANGNILHEKTEPEYLSAEPYMFGGVLFVATFIPRVNAQSEEACADVGVGKLYMLDPTTGKALTRLPSYTLENAKIAGFSGSGTELGLTISVKELKSGALDAMVGTLSEFDVMNLGSGTMQMREPPKGISPEPSNQNLEPYVPHPQYWRDSF